MASLNIELPILETIKDHQMQHGLKYENYRNYRTYCSRRLHRIRRSLNVAQGIAPSAKARHQRARKLVDVSNAMVLEASEKSQDYAERVLLIPLCLAERAWSHAMQLKQEVTDQPRKRFHLVRRLKKAAKYASNFEKLVHDPESPCSDRTKQEATAYSSYVNGLYKLEREMWAEAKEDLKRSLHIYFTLVLSIRNDDVIEHYRQRIEELRASLKYCAFNLNEKERHITVQLPSQLKFHDIAFRHALREQERGEESTMAVDTKPAETKRVEVTKEDVTRTRKDSRKDEEDEEDEFEDADEVEEDDDSDDDSDQDDDRQQQQQAGGVTALVKGWLGGGWSKN